ncbi:uncharacterized protein LOC107223190 [Neodiprion lecontei]|uniref:Uncharacterized protein LOC107223190 n=1 Tax=Neodiprion lecontei TaxID=441921 RepID=A0A6J0BW53_NEOLC|nr:uncharacterized protein LOC107223190 [Neodiprion lecontei]XP_046587010.1 uncharacterized protein LOC107223190 [Neodiprion lecontei]
MQQPTSRLHNLMAKYRVKPSYELISSENGQGFNKFVMRIICPISRDGLALTAEGCYGLSKKEAKCNAAEAFMEKYLNANYKTFARTQEYATCVINIDPVNRHLVLQNLCSLNNLGQPKYADMSMDSLHSTVFKVECKVFYLCAVGQGQNKDAARLEATTRMIKILMEAASICEIFESSESMISSHSNDIVCLSDNLRGPQLSVPICVFGKRKSSNVLTKVCAVDDASMKSGSKTSVDSNLGNKLYGLFKYRNKVREREQDSADAAASVEPTTFADKFQNKASIGKESGETCNYALDSTDDRINNSNLDPSCQTLTGLQVNTKVRRTLENVEKQLHNEIIDILKYSNLPGQRIVKMFNSEFKVFISRGTSALIYQGINDCTDTSTRIACLAKLLLDLKEYINEKK